MDINKDKNMILDNLTIYNSNIIMSDAEIHAQKLGIEYMKRINEKNTILMNMKRKNAIKDETNKKNPTYYLIVEDMYNKIASFIRRCFNLKVENPSDILNEAINFNNRISNQYKRMDNTISKIESELNHLEYKYNQKDIK